MRPCAKSPIFFGWRAAKPKDKEEKMSRTTVDDCVGKCDNRFSLTYFIALRAREIQRRGNALVEERNDKAIVVALREVVNDAVIVPPLAHGEGDNSTA